MFIHDDIETLTFNKLEKFAYTLFSQTNVFFFQADVKNCFSNCENIIFNITRKHYFCLLYIQNLIRLIKNIYNYFGNYTRHLHEFSENYLHFNP